MKWKVESEKWKMGGGKRITFHAPLSVFLLLALLLFSSCHARKKLVSPMAHAADYEWMSAKMSGAVNMESEEVPFTGALRMQRDSVIWISANALMGMEAMRARITNDSVVVINRLEKTYLSEPLAEVAASLQLPLTLPETQALLLGDGRSDQVELCFGPYTAKIRYDDIHWNEPTTFPIKINQNYERVKP